MTDFIYDLTPNDQTCLICLAGPTASGKSDLAMTLARNSKDIVINADSCQIFQELQILTARPKQCDMADIPHMLYGHISLSAQYSVQLWCQEVSEIIKKISSNGGGRIILVGGTGLYFHSLLNGIAHIPDIDPDIRHVIRHMARDDIYAALCKEDAIAAEKFHKNDTQRIARALEVVRSTCRPISYWQENTQSFLPKDIKYESFALMPDRDTLYKRINKRFDIMMMQGALEEAQNIKKLFAENDVYKDIARKIVGLSELISYLDGEMTYEEAIERAKQSSRNYAKRQMTWFRNKGHFNLVFNN